MYKPQNSHRNAQQFEHGAFTHLCVKSGRRKYSCDFLIDEHLCKEGEADPGVQCSTQLAAVTAVRRRQTVSTVWEGGDWTPVQKGHSELSGQLKADLEICRFITRLFDFSFSLYSCHSTSVSSVFLDYQQRCHSLSYSPISCFFCCCNIQISSCSSKCKTLI